MTTRPKRYVVEVLEGRRLLSGQIFPGQRFASPDMSPVAKAADVNGEGLIDLVTANDGISVMLGHGDGTFDAPLSSAPAPYSFSQLGDFNNDGNVDLVADNGSINGQILFAAGFGDGTFRVPSSVSRPGKEGGIE